MPWRVPPQIGYFNTTLITPDTTPVIFPNSKLVDVRAPRSPRVVVKHQGDEASLLTGRERARQESASSVNVV